MLQFSLRPEDRDLLVDIVEEYLTDLREEIGDTDSFDYRKNLEGEAKTVGEILDTLTHGQENSQTLSPSAKGELGALS